MKVITADYGFRTKDFNDIFPNVDAFNAAYGESEFPMDLTNEEVSLIYYLLYSRYGNSTICSNDENRFIYNLFSIIWQYAPTWKKKLKIQERLRELEEDDLLKGSKAIYNHSYNPGTEPSTATLEELTTINEQNTTNYKKSVLEGYSNLLMLLETDVTEDFLRRFKYLFISIAVPGNPLVYITEED